MYVERRRPYHTLRLSDAPGVCVCVCVCLCVCGGGGGGGGEHAEFS